jgi:hypothetical protein
MSEKTWKRNTTGIIAHAQSRKQDKRRGVEDALTVLLREQRPVNFNTVAKAARVSKAYLYSQQDLRALAFTHSALIDCQGAIARLLEVLHNNVSFV